MQCQCISKQIVSDIRLHEGRSKTEAPGCICNTIALPGPGDVPHPRPGMNTPMAIAVGVALGLRHATDADHVVALATLLRRQSGVRGALMVGAVWGIGHTIVLMAAGVMVVLLGIRIPPAFDRVAQLAVAAMLVGLGVHHLVRRPDGHAHGGAPRAGDPGRTFRPLLVGMVHGLAGSAGIALLTLTTIRERGVAMLYLSLFGVGTVAGMMALTGLLAIPLCAAARFPWLEPWIVRLASVASLGLGLLLAVQCSLS
jgi:hypothetical protein